MLFCWQENFHSVRVLCCFFLVIQPLNCGCLRESPENGKYFMLLLRILSIKALLQCVKTMVVILWIYFNFLIVDTSAINEVVALVVFQVNEQPRMRVETTESDLFKTFYTFYIHFLF